MRSTLGFPPDGHCVMKGVHHTGVKVSERVQVSEFNTRRRTWFLFPASPLRDRSVLVKNHLLQGFLLKRMLRRFAFIDFDAQTGRF
jgi:hypothetical protein